MQIHEDDFSQITSLATHAFGIQKYPWEHRYGPVDGEVKWRRYIFTADRSFNAQRSIRLDREYVLTDINVTPFGIERR